MDVGTRRAQACRWCRLVETGENVVHDDPAFLVVEPTPGRRKGRATLVTKAHVSVATDLSPSDMAAVLAGLAALSDRIRCGSSDVQIIARPSSTRQGRGHLHFDLVPEVPTAKKSGRKEAVDVHPAAVPPIKAIRS
jgi:diadenosine tetraphosphate (Ap4A) HIT family hydrolase